MIDVHGVCVADKLFPVTAVSSATTVNGTGLSVVDYDCGFKIIFQVNAGTGTTPTLDVKIQDSADNSAWADLSPALAFTQVTTVASLQSIGIPSNSVRQYLRAVATTTGTTPTYSYNVIIVGEKANK